MKSSLENWQKRPRLKKCSLHLVISRWGLWILVLWIKTCRRKQASSLQKMCEMETYIINTQVSKRSKRKSPMVAKWIKNKTVQFSKMNKLSKKRNITILKRKWKSLLKMKNLISVKQRWTSSNKEPGKFWLSQGNMIRIYHIIRVKPRNMRMKGSHSR